MRSSLPTPDAQLLLEHAQWMRVLARKLVADPERADELSQETWMRILERPPRLDSPFRGWIATVMRNLLHAERRGAARRATREAASARAEAQPSSHDLLERATLQRELVQAVLELEEPYRSTVLLRYFEERTPQEIASSARIPVSTVKTRLARGIARLRERLARTHGPDGRTSVLLALAHIEAPALRWSPCSETKIAAASLAMNTKLLVPLALVLAAGLVYVLSARTPATASPRASEREPSEAHVALAPVSPGASPAVAQRERAGPERATRPATTPAVPAPTLPARVRGRVIDAHGRPVVAVEVVLSAQEAPENSATHAEAESAPVVARTDAEGVFELDGQRHGRLFVQDLRWTTVLAGVPVDQRSGQECRIVVAPSIALEGFVLDDLSLPLGGARVALTAPPTLRASLAQVLDFSVDVPWETRSDERGRFQLAAAPAIAEGELRAELEGYAPHAEPAPLVARNDLVVVLARPGAGGASLRGTVVDTGGLPVAEALVSYGVDTTRTDEDGRFAFSLGDPDSFNHMAARFGMHVPEGLLRALKRGFLPAELRAARASDGQLEWPRPIVLRLGSEALTLAGRVLDARGEPLAGMRVWIADATFFGGLVRDSDSERFPQFVQVEALLAGAGPDWTWAESDGDGRFELSGLTEREYTLAVMDPATLQRTDLPNVAAGRRNVVLVLPTDELLPRLAGRVLDGHGKPLPNLAVFPMCDALETRVEGQTVGTQHEVAPGTTTDQDGWFQLERVPERAVYLRIQGADTIPLEWGRGLAGGLAELAGKSREKLVITVERRCHFQVELAVPDEADELGVLDAGGHELTISEFLGSGRNDNERHPIVAGRSSTLAVGERAAALVLYRAGSEVRRVALTLEPGPPASLRL